MSICIMCIVKEKNGDLENGITYKVEKLNSKRLPLEDGQKDIYFLHIKKAHLKWT